MSMLERLRRLIRGSEPTIVDYESYRATGTEGPGTSQDSVLHRIEGAPQAAYPAYPATPGTYKIQQSYDSLLDTVKELREVLDGQQKRQDELLTRLSALPQAAEALPQTTKMQSDMLKMINERLAMHAEQQRKVGEVLGTIGKAKLASAPGGAEALAEAVQSIRDQIEMGNEIDRQLVESFNRFSMMIDRLHMANNHAVAALQQVRDSYAQSAMQMQEWIEKSRHRNNWVLGFSFIMSLLALTSVMVLFYVLSQPIRGTSQSAPGLAPLVETRTP